jgi:hypothetical protein
MVSSPKPTPHQLRQHALDRALQPDVVQALARTRPSTNLEGQELAERILVVATEFTAWLAGPVEHEETPPEKANLGLATTRDLILELHSRGKVAHPRTNIKSAMFGLMSDLEHDLVTLNYRTADND